MKLKIYNKIDQIIFNQIPTENLTIFDNFMRVHKYPTRLWIGTRLFILLNNPDDIKAVLTSPHCLSKSDSYHFVKETFSGEGLLTSEGT